MNTRRGLGVALCVLGLIAVCVLAIVLPTGGPFAGMQGIQNNLSSEAETVLVDFEAEGSLITAEGRDLRIDLPDRVGARFDRPEIQRQLNDIEGVRSVEIIGDPAVEGAAEPETPEPTPVPEPTPAPTAVPATPVPPTAVPATPEPVEVAPSLVEVVAGLQTGGVEFEDGTAVLTSQDMAFLDDVAAQLEGQTGGPVGVQAHTDNVGDPDVNLLLSQDRAEAVATYLIDRGVDASLLEPRGFGASAPIADNDTEQGRADNRRVEFVVEGN